MVRMRIGLLVLAVIAVTGALVAMSPGSNQAKFRVGVYDNRAIAIAYASSEYNAVKDKMQEFEAAKADGNEEKVKELEAWGKKQQAKLHRQGFGRVPVDDLLAHVKDHFPELAGKLGIDAIAWDCDYASPDVEVVDITKEIAMLFGPNERTLKMLDQIKDHPPVDLDELMKHEDH